MPQLGEQPEGPHVPLVHTFDAQSPSFPHASPSLHIGEQAGFWHLTLHTRERQSESVLQVSPGLHAGEQAGGPQIPSLAHTFDAQSVLLPHLLPSLHVGEQAGFWQLTLHTPERQSELALHA